MIISFSKRFVFIHLHKCAGESVERHMAPHLKPWDILVGPGRSGPEQIPSALARRVFNLHKHSSASEARRFLRPRRYESFLSFTIVRHPEDRIVSLYRYIIGRARKTFPLPSGEFFEEALDEFWWNQNLTIETARMESRKERLKRFSSIPKIGAAYRWPAIDAVMSSRSLDEFVQHPSLKLDPAYESQISRISDRQSGQRLVRFVLRQDRLDDDWPPIAKRIGDPEALPHHNSSKNTERTQVSSAARSEIEAAFKEDYEAFGFQFR